jgi:DNA gyrase subunit B
MSIYKRGSLLRLEDCQRHGHASGAELYIVEGESASQAVCGLRDPEFQAVLPMQGKPANAAKASKRVLQSNSLFQALNAALGFPELQLQPPRHTQPQAIVDVAACRYQRVILLFDPDADGIHCGALMLIYFFTQLKDLLEAGYLGVVRPPLMELTYRQTLRADAPLESRFAYTEEELQQLQRELILAGVMQLKTHRTRGLGGMRSTLLRQTCMDPLTRNLFPLSTSDGQRALTFFGPSRTMDGRK